jgi:hypothetical protein
MCDLEHLYGRPVLQDENDLMVLCRTVLCVVVLCLLKECDVMITVTSF